MAGLADLEYAYLGTLGATGRTLSDRRLAIYGENEHAYFAALSGLTPAQRYSLSDHKLAYYRAQSGLPNAGMAEAMFDFWSNPSPPPPAGDISVSLVATGTDDLSASTYTFAAQPLGAAAADRLIVVCVSTRANNDVDSVTVAGVAATQVVTTALSVQGQAAIFVAAVPTGTSGDIVVGATGGATRMMMAAYRMVGANPTATATIDTNGASIATPNGGALFGVSTNYLAGGKAECTWSVFTESADLIADAIINHSSGFLEPTSAGSSAVTATWTASTDNFFTAAAVFAPA